MYTLSVCKSIEWHGSSCTIFDLLVLMITKYLLFFWSNVWVLILPGLLRPVTSGINCSRCPSTVLGTCDLFCRLGGIFYPPLVSSMVSKHSTILCLFLAAKDVRARWRCFELGENWHHFFPGIFYFFFKFSVFFTDFFLPRQVKPSLSTQPQEPWTLLLQRTFPIAPYIQI